MPSISNQDYKHIYTGVARDEIASASKNVRKAIARAIEDGTIFDCILHFNEGGFDGIAKVIYALKTEEDAPYYIILGSHANGGVAEYYFGIE